MPREPSRELIAMAIRICTRSDEVFEYLCHQRYPSADIHRLPREVTIPARAQALVIAMLEVWSDDA